MVNIIRSKVVDSTNDFKEQKNVYGQYYKVEGGRFDKRFKRTKTMVMVNITSVWWSLLEDYII
jgi:hypothetical protein